MQCLNGNKEIIDEFPLFVSPCILSTPVNLMQECDNKVAQKSASFIIENKILISAMISVTESNK